MDVSIAMDVIIARGYAKMLSETLRWISYLSSTFQL
jgi:hypothetical protein